VMSTVEELLLELQQEAIDVAHRLRDRTGASLVRILRHSPAFAAPREWACYPAESIRPPNLDHAGGIDGATQSAMGELECYGIEGALVSRYELLDPTNGCWKGLRLALRGGCVATASIDLLWPSENGIAEGWPVVNLCDFLPRLILIVERTFLLELLSGLPLQDSTDMATERAALDDLARQVRAASQMSCVFLLQGHSREDEISVLAESHLNSSNSGPSLDGFISEEASRLLSRAVRSNDSYYVSDTERAFPQLARGILRNIRSIVVAPVRITDANPSVMVFGSVRNGTYSKFHVACLTTLALHMTMSVRKRRESASTLGIAIEQHDIFRSITAVEVMAGARHTLQHDLEVAGTQLADAMALTKKGTRERKPSQYAREAQRCISDAMHLIRSCRDLVQSTRILWGQSQAFESKATSTKSVFMEARIPLLRTMNAARIECNYMGEDHVIVVAHDLLRTIFMHLVLNSVQAHQSQTRLRRPRFIQFIGKPSADEDSYIRLLCVDNAGGIDAKKLRKNGSILPTGGVGFPSDMSVEDVFLPGVTSSSFSSGYGLTICRRSLVALGGSITLLDSRQGVALELVLPKASQT
jgi:signal transduction histidine kinase